MGRICDFVIYCPREGMESRAARLRGPLRIGKPPGALACFCQG